MNDQELWTTGEKETKYTMQEYSIAELTQQVNGALKAYQSVLALARSPLADSALVEPLLVLDDVSPTADERGHALRLVLQWAVLRLTPGPIQYPFGVERPYDDPTWRDPLWWRYNILRHRYLEPLHPDEFIDGGRYTETLLALTGITSTDAFFDERTRAIREVAQRLQEQLRHGQAKDELQALALEEVLRPLQRNPTQEELLGIAATFDDVFPRRLLLRMARTERLNNPEQVLDTLTAGRYLLMGDGGLNLWLSPVLQPYVHARQPANKMRNRHLAAADYYRQQDEPLKAADHLQQAGEWAGAAQVLLDAADELVNDLQTEELLTALGHFRAEQLETEVWCAIQIVRCDLHRRHGQQEAALAACRQALRVVTKNIQQGQLYWRMGKLYEKRNQLQALGYYERAMSSLSVTDDHTLPLLAEVRKDRGWLYILRHEWSAAQEDLQAALRLLTPKPATDEVTPQPSHPLAPTHGEMELQANVLDALAHLHLEQSHFQQAIDYAQRALHLREEAGDLLQLAKSFNNLGNFYNHMGEVNEAVAAHDEAIQLYQTLNNLELEAEAWLNRGVVYHTAGRQREAVENYHKSLRLSQRLGLLWPEVTAHANLTEAHAELGEQQAAQQHWRYGYAISEQANFPEELAYFGELQERFDLQLTEFNIISADKESEPLPSAYAPLPPRAMLSPDEQAILMLAVERGRISPRSIMAIQHVSKATATRRLATLTAAGFLIRTGKGRATSYLPAQKETGDAVATAIEGTSQQTHGLPLPDRVSGTRYPQAGSLNVAAMQALLNNEWPTLQRAYTVEAYAFLPPTVPVSAPISSTNLPMHLIQRIAVRFTATPSLATFFQLKRLLSNVLACTVDLIPVDELAQEASPVVASALQWVVAPVQ